VPNAHNRISTADEHRRARVLNTEQILSRSSPQGIALEELRRAFARAHEAYPELSGWIYFNGVPVPRGPGSLEFCELGTRAMSVLLGDLGESDWKTWLDVLLTYLLQYDTEQEFLQIFQGGHLEPPAETAPETHLLVEAENYEIRKLFKVSEHCCTWLKRRYGGASEARRHTVKARDMARLPGVAGQKNTAVSGPSPGRLTADVVARTPTGSSRPWRNSG
jgi:hypothetical protein